MSIRNPARNSGDLKVSRSCFTRDPAPPPSLKEPKREVVRPLSRSSILGFIICRGINN